MQNGLHERIEVNSGVMAGKPVIKGTRIPVDLIIRLMSQGINEKEILEDYPNLKIEDIRAALEYGADIVKGEDVFPLIKLKKGLNGNRHSVQN